MIATLATRAAADGHRRRRRHRRPRLVPARRATRTSRCSTTSAASPTTRSTTKPASSSAPGVTPAQYPEYAALRGDTSDNLPGVPGIGEKTAAKLVTTYGNLEGIFEHLDDLPPKQRQNLGECARPRVPEPRDVDPAAATSTVGVEPDDLAQGAFDREQVRVLFDQLEFRTLLPRLLEAVGETSAADAPRPTTLDVEVDVAARRRRPRSRVLDELADGRRARRDRAALGRRAGSRAPLRGSAIADATTRVTYVDARAARDADGARRARRARRRRRARRSSRTGPRS